MGIINSQSVINHHSNIKFLLPAMVQNVAVNILTPILMSIGIIGSLF